MATRIKPIKATVIKDREVWKQIQSEVKRRPTPDVLNRHERELELLRMLRR